MELGQMIFGNEGPKGCTFQADRGLYTSVFEPLWPLIDTYGDGYIKFENDVFRVFPYYWGDCKCGFEDRDIEWANLNPHHDNCWLERFDRATHNLDLKTDEKWALDNGWPLEEDGEPRPEMAVYCDCGNDEAYQRWRAENDHSDTCPTIQPNFHYKPTGVMLTWYKYPFRSAYVNQELSAAELVKIVQHCMESVCGL